MEGPYGRPLHQIVSLLALLGGAGPALDTATEVAGDWLGLDRSPAGIERALETALPVDDNARWAALHAWQAARQGESDENAL